MSVETLDFGEITDYNSERGFGFVGRTLRRPSGGRGDVFFHIRAVKQADPGIARNLDRDQYQGVGFWFVTEHTEKGEQVRKLWFDAAGIPEPLRRTVVADILARWQDLDSREPAWLEGITERLLGRDECARLKSKRQAEIDERRRAEERKRQEELALARQAEERRRAQAEVERFARAEAEQRRLREAQTLRAMGIQRICKARGIDALVHFTRLENLASILRHGLLGRDRLHQLGLRVRFNDALRLDGCSNAVCASISFPNYRMFYGYRTKTPQAQWVVLVLDPAILWELDCAFCLENAASNAVTGVPLNERRSPQYLAAMFGDLPSVQRARLGIPNHYPTNPQAEVLVFNPIEPARIRQVHFRTAQEAMAWLNANPGYAQKLVGSPCFFGPRCDYAHWPSAYSSAYHEDLYADNPF